jgi:hypothetical protein
MNNIHLVSTKEKSRLHYFVANRAGYYLYPNGKSVIPRNPNCINKYIYITNDDKVEVGDWVFNTFNGSIYKIVPTTSARNILAKIESLIENDILAFPEQYLKIILTSDYNLIDNHIQSIPEDFLEWFVNNSDCVKVLTVHEPINYFEPKLGWEYTIVANLKDPGFNNTLKLNKEEPKQIKCYDKFNQVLSEGDYVDVQKDGVQKIYKKKDGQLYFSPYGEEDRVISYFSNDLSKCDEVGNWINNDRYEDISDNNVETIEEAFNNISNSIDFTEFDFHSFKLGVEWKEKISYSEEEVELITNEMVMWTIDNIGKQNPQSGKKFDEIIGKFKKK